MPNFRRQKGDQVTILKAWRQTETTKKWIEVLVYTSGHFADFWHDWLAWISSDYFESLLLPQLLSLRSKRFRAVSRVKDRAKNGASKRERGGSRFISRAAKTENLVPRSFFAPKQHGNACYAGYQLLRGENDSKKSDEIQANNWLYINRFYEKDAM